jgi:hypothetical protein
MRRLLLSWLVVGCLSGCGCNEQDLVGETDAGDDVPTVDMPVDDGLLVDVPEEEIVDTCEESTEALVGEIARSEPRSCTAVIRLDFLTRTIKAYALFCSDPMEVSEESARSVAVEDVVLEMPYYDFTTAEMLNDPDPQDAYIFYQPPWDFGGLAVVSPYTGLTVFGGSMMWMGTGAIAYPTEWLSSSHIGAGCPPSAALEPVTYYPLECEFSVPDPDLDSTLEIVAGTAMPAAMASAGEIDSVVVICYPRRLGMFVPEQAEWLVLLNVSG